MTRVFRVLLTLAGPLLVVLASAFAMAGCTPHIGDPCALSTDCSVQGTLVCDTSQPGGYCTQLNCAHQSCPANSLCVLFQASIPGCGYDDYQSPSRTGRSFCMENCSKDSDCRQSEGYVCQNPTASPWNGAILDDNQSQGVCIVGPGLLADAGTNFAAPICQAYSADAGSGAVDGGDASTDAQTAADANAREAGADDGGAEAGSDGGADATIDAPADAGFADAPTGG